MAIHNEMATLIWQIADLLRGPYRTTQYERVMLPLTVLRRFDSVFCTHQGHGAMKLTSPATSTPTPRPLAEIDAKLEALKTEILKMMTGNFRK